MFSYIMLGTNDLPRAITFYDPLMEMLGYPRAGRNEEGASCNKVVRLKLPRFIHPHYFNHNYWSLQPVTFTNVERFYSTQLTLFFICSALRVFT